MSNFKKTLRTIVLFFLIVTVFSIGIMEAFFAGENYYYQDARERAELRGTLDFLVCGSSHAMRALEPVILDDELGVSSYNVSNSNATIQGRYEMIKVETEQNPVNTVILEVSYNSMTRGREVRGYEGDYYILSRLDIRHRIPYFFSAVKPSEYINIYYHLMMRGFSCIDMMVHGTWTDKNDRMIKGYVPYDELRYEADPSDVMVDEYSDIYNTEILPEEVDEQNVKYLDKIVDFCNQNDIQLIMITVPMSKTFISKYQNLDAPREWYEEYAQDNGIQYYDFNLYKENEALFSDDEDFHDANHLNNIGADKFSKLFASVYKSIENREDVANLFYNSYEEMKAVVF